MSGIPKIQQTSEYNKKEIGSQIQRTTRGYQWGEGRGGDNVRGRAIESYKLLGIK